MSYLLSIGEVLSVGELIKSLLEMLGGLGAFLVAVKIMSDTMNRLTNVGLKKLFQRLGKNKLLGVGLGSLTAAVLHSSAITTVMIVGFVNSGAMLLDQAASIIMGANIGTTFTALVAGLGSSFDFMSYATVLAFIGMFVCAISKTEKVKNIGYMTAGLGLLVISLQFMQSAIAPIQNSQQVRDVIAAADNPFLMLLVGIVLTALLQSSTAVTTILISMASVFCVEVNGMLTITNSVLFIILGTNIGTCLTAIMASIEANTNAKRAGVIHLLFNVIGSVVFFVLLLCWKDFATDTVGAWFIGKPSMQIAVFHLLFNTISTLMFLPFSSLLVKLAMLILPDKADEKAREVMYIDDRFLATPSIAVFQAKKEANHIGDLVMDTCDVAIKAFLDVDPSAEESITQSLSEITVLNQRLVQYLVSISANNSTTKHSEGTISALYYVMGDLMRVGDLSTNIAKYTRKVADGEIVFTPIVYTEVNNMYGKVRQMYALAMDCFITKDVTKLALVEQAEEEIDVMRKELVNRHIERLNKGECSPQSNSVFINLVGNIERMADHITFIAESITKHPDNG